MLFLREIISELFYRKTRAILTIAAVAWGVFAITVTLAVGEGLRNNFKRIIENASSKSLTIYPGETTKSYKGVSSGMKLKFSKKDVEGIRVLHNVDKLSVQYDFQVRLRYKDNTADQTVRAVSEDYLDINNLHVNSGHRGVSVNDLKSRNRVVVLGVDVDKELFDPKDDPINKTIYIDSKPFKVIGVVQKRTGMLNEATWQFRSSLIPFTTYKLLSGSNSIDAIIIKYKDIDLAEQTKSQIKKIIAMNHGFSSKDNGVLRFSDYVRVQKKINSFFINMQIVLGMIGSLTLFLAGIGVANVMYAIVKRSRRQIGIKMALGATTKDIVCRYILESMVPTIMGGLIGMVMAVGFVYAFKLLPMKGFIFNYFGRPDPKLSFLVIIIVIMCLGLTGFLAGLFPALRAAKIDPAEALSYE